MVVVLVVRLLVSLFNMRFSRPRRGRSQILFGNQYLLVLGPFVCPGGSCRAELLLLGICFELSGLGGGVHLRLPQLCLYQCLTLVVLVLVEVLGYQVGSWWRLQCRGLYMSLCCCWTSSTLAGCFPWWAWEMSECLAEETSQPASCILCCVR